MQSRNIFISAGHTNVPGKDRGVSGVHGLIEGDLTVELRALIIKELKLLGENVWSDPDNMATDETVQVLTALVGIKDIALDIHFNAFATSNIPHGTEVLVPFKSTYFEDMLAKDLVDNVSALLGTKNRGVKTEAASVKGTLLFMRPNCENILIEVCFITNELDVKLYTAKKNFTAVVIAKCLFDFISK